MSSVSVRFNSFFSFIRFSMNTNFNALRWNYELRFRESRTATLLSLWLWSVWMDSNHRPHAYQACALTTWATNRFLSLNWYWFKPSSYPFGSRHCRVVEMMGIEPMTPCLQGRCSPSWATPPYLRVCSFSMIINNPSVASDPWKLNNKSSILAFTQNFSRQSTPRSPWKDLMVSIERRWSSRTFRYGYLVTT